MELDFNKVILIIAAILAIGTGVFVFQNEPQDTAIVESYVNELNDEVIIKDLIVTVDVGVTQEEVIEAVKEEYPDYEVISVSQEGNKFLVRIKKVGEDK
jgi:hypothetical protein